MTKKMLIDASHAEETRVVVLDGNRLEDFDVETANRKQIKGNIYLAKVIRVEPSLQAAFVEYGGNRHGFLAFGEIHPDYYQIPVADRKRLLALQAEDAAEEEEHAEAEVTPVSAQPLEIKPVEILAAPPPEEILPPAPLEGEGEAATPPELAETIETVPVAAASAETPQDEPAAPQGETANGSDAGEAIGGEAVNGESVAGEVVEVEQNGEQAPPPENLGGDGDDAAEARERRQRQ